MRQMQFGQTRLANPLLLLSFKTLFHFIPNPIREGLRAGKANLIPGLILQGMALSILLGYAFFPDCRMLLDQWAGFRQRMGWGYAPLATAFFGGILPFIWMRLNPKTRPFTPVSHILFFIPFWAYKGIEVDTLYHVQNFLFGEGHQLRTIFGKVFFDQFIYNPIWSAPLAVILFRWKDGGFGFRNLFLGWPQLLRRKLPAALISTWGVWIPTVAIVYSLPNALQIPIFNLVLCFWVLLFTTLSQSKSQE